MDQKSPVTPREQHRSIYSCSQLCNRIKGILFAINSQGIHLYFFNYCCRLSWQIVIKSTYILFFSNLIYEISVRDNINNYCTKSVQVVRHGIAVYIICLFLEIACCCNTWFYIDSTLHSSKYHNIIITALHSKTEASCTIFIFIHIILFIFTPV